MESILRGIVASSHPEALKEQLLKKFCSTMTEEPKAPEEVEKLLKLFIEWILFSENKVNIQLGLAQFRILSENNLNVFSAVVNANFIIDIFTNAVHVNKTEIPALIAIIFDLFKLKDPDIDRSLVNVAKSHIMKFFKEQGVHLQIAAGVSQLYRRHTCLLPDANHCHVLARHTVRLLAGFPTPDPVTKEFLTQSEELSCLLPLLWEHSPNKDECITDCLRNFYSLISCADSYCRPSCALMNFLEKTPRVMLEGCVRIIVDEKAKDNEPETVQVLRTMIGWICVRQSLLLSDWLFRILKKLHTLNKNSVLIEVSHLTIEKLLESLVVREVQASVEPLFFYLLLGFQHSEAATFFKIAQKMPDTLTKLSSMSKSFPSIADRCQRISANLAEAVFFFAEMFPGFEKIMKPVVDYVESTGAAHPDENRINHLKSQGWFSNHLEKVSIVRSGSDSSKPITQYRSETGMVGLVNLGNTCYCNSIIQALYMTTQFHDLVMSAPSGGGQTVIHNLQQTFAFLRHSLRSIYSPAEFIKAARPPWFEIGRQQDCSEFLRHLLHTMHEQEKKSLGLTSLSVAPRDHRIKRRDLEDDQAASMDTEPGSVKQSCSSSALDAISEAPEDEDMISQGSGTQMEEIYGSRSSLGAENAALDLEDDDDEDEENILGSRGSLNGLKRWTTEENLCSDLRDGNVVEFSVAPIHDSHSNSTDSGIQSVGDSIRGSSDSMSNAASTGGASSEVEPMEVQASTETETKAEMTSLPVAKLLPVSIEEKVFGGKIQTSYECCRCHTVSIHNETFNDLLLPFPDSKETSVKPSTATVAPATEPDASPAETTETSESATSSEPSESTSQTVPAKSALTMQDMLNGNLEPEKLEGDNKYHCEKCNSLQDAVKTTKITESPNHLKCILMRFEYDRKSGTKRKIHTDIQYDLTMTLPVGEGETKEDHLYTLYAIVVHSGVSSDSGHYYTYARHPKVFDESDLTLENLDEVRRNYDQESRWFIFNDSKVSFTTFESFVNMKNRFHSDTAYVLFYQRFFPPAESATSKVLLRADLQTNVERDNIKFIREKERSTASTASLFVAPSTTSGPRRQKDDDSDEDGSGLGGGRGCGGSDFNTPGRFVF